MRVQLPTPDVTGQPAWVAVALGVLGLLAVLGTAWLASSARKSGTQAPPEQATLPAGGGPDATVTVLQTAVEHLARVSEREAAESEEARKETEIMRRKLHRSQEELRELRSRAERAEMELAQCRAHTSFLSREAMRRGEHDE